MRQIPYFLLLPIILASAHANAWVFYFPHDIVTRAPFDRSNATRGGHCVGESANIGDVLPLPEGSFGTVKVLSGRSAACPTPGLPIRALIVPATNVVHQQQPAIRRIGINLPYGWAPAGTTDDQRRAGIRLVARSPRKDMELAVAAVNREAIPDIAAYASTLRANQMALLQEVEASTMTHLDVHGRPAWRFSVSGKAPGTPSGVVYVTTVVDAGPQVVAIDTWARAEDYQTQKEKMEGFSELLVGLEAVSTAPPSVPGPLPTPVPAPRPVPPAAPPAAAVPLVVPEPSPGSVAGQTQSAAPDVAVTPAAEKPAPRSAPTYTEISTKPVARSKGAPAQRLRELRDMLQDGTITQQDYDKKKQEILDGM